MKKISTIILFLITLMSEFTYAVNPFTFYSSAWPMGMGGAFTAVQNDINGILYNPACFLEPSKTKIINRGLLLSGWGGSLSNDGHIGFSSCLNVNGMSLIGSFNKFKLSDKYDYTTKIGIVFANRVFENVSIGFSLYFSKELTSDELSGESTSFIGQGDFLDVGVLWQQNTELSWGLVIHKIMQANSEYTRFDTIIDQNFPTGATIGSVYKIPNSRNLLAFDITDDDFLSNKVEYRAGYE